MIRTAAKILFFSKTQAFFSKKKRISIPLEKYSKNIILLGQFSNLQN
jgi:hypothetical protein